ncbi:MAG: DUF4298 domain-containing protein [Bacteroidaceae bacterium]|nr:DUF4298 domain-containing protein [Bacteroidaceae bacterium]
MKRADKKEQIQRIRKMERHFGRASSAIKQLSAALDKYEEAQESISALSDYYGSEDWKQDFADDEARLLPQDLKRGVFSEDGIWNLIEANKELQDKLYSAVIVQR